jgi:hypothetical protein
VLNILTLTRLLEPLYNADPAKWQRQLKDVKQLIIDTCKSLSGASINDQLPKPDKFTGKSRSKSLIPTIVQRLTENLEYKDSLYHFYLDREFSSAEIQKYLFSKG